jgi:hypothetical protein
MKMSVFLKIFKNEILAKYGVFRDDNYLKDKFIILKFSRLELSIF